MKHYRYDVGMRVRVDEKCARLIDKAAEISGMSRSAFIRDAALNHAARIILNYASHKIGDVVRE